MGAVFIKELAANAPSFHFSDAVVKGLKKGAVVPLRVTASKGPQWEFLRDGLG